MSTGDGGMFMHDHAPIDLDGFRPPNYGMPTTGTRERTMFSTLRLRAKFAVYRMTNDPTDAVEMASHIPALLDIIDTQHAIIELASKSFDTHQRKLDRLIAELKDQGQR